MRDVRKRALAAAIVKGCAMPTREAASPTRTSARQGRHRTRCHRIAVPCVRPRISWDSIAYRINVRHIPFLGQSPDYEQQFVPGAANCMSNREPRYFIDPHDGRRGMFAKEWARFKYRIVDHYVEICRPVRAKHGGGCYVELFSGPGRVWIRNDGASTEGSPLVAWNRSVRPARGAAQPFRRCFFADADLENVSALRARTDHLNVPADVFHGEAVQTVDEVVQRLPTDGFHFAFLDPFNIQALPISIIEKLAKWKRMDILVHFSVMDVVRNMGLNLTGAHNNLEQFAPNWRRTVEEGLDETRRRYFEHWTKLAARLGKQVVGHPLPVTHKGKQLYWLVLLSRHPLAEKFWDAIRPTDPQLKMF